MYRPFTFMKRVVIVMLCITMSIITAVPSFAASKITLKSGKAAPASIYVGHTYTLKVPGTSVKFYSSNKKVATIGMTTGKLKPVAPGTVKITAKNKKTGKTVATKSFKVLQRAESIKADVEALFLDSIGDTATLKATKTPTTSTDVIKFYSSDRSVATVGVTSGKVTAKGEGTCQITIYALATKATSTKSKYNKVTTVEVNVGPVIESCQQKSRKKIELIFKASLKDIKGSDLMITEQNSKTVYPIKEVSIDKENPKIMHIETVDNLPNQSTYTVTYGKSSAQFISTDGIITQLIISPTKIPYGKEETIYVHSVDANGVVLESYNREEAQRGHIELEIDTPIDGYKPTPNSIKFNSLIGSCHVKATYTGKQENKLFVEETISAAEGFKPTIRYAINNNERPDFEGNDFKQEPKLYLGDGEMMLHCYLIDDQGKEIQKYTNYKIESEDATQLTVTGMLDNLSKKVFLNLPASSKPGVVNLRVLDNMEELVQTLPIEIMASRQLTTLALTTTSRTVYKECNEEFIDFSAKDQYGEEIVLSQPDYFERMTIEMKSAPKDSKLLPNVSFIKDVNGKVQLKIGSVNKEILQGTYVYEITVNLPSGEYKSIIFNVVIKDGPKPEGNTNIEIVGDNTIDLASDKAYLEMKLQMVEGKEKIQVVEITKCISGQENTSPKPKVIQDVLGNYLLRFDISSEKVAAGQYEYQVNCVCLDDKGENNIYKKPVTITVTDSRPVKSEIEVLEVQQNPGVSLVTEGHGEVKADFVVTDGGTQVTLTAFPDEGYYLKEWCVIEGAADIINNRFMMPNQPVTIQGVFETIKDA